MKKEAVEQAKVILPHEVITRNSVGDIV